MSRTTILATPALLATLIGMAAPADAAQRDGPSRGGGTVASAVADRSDPDARTGTVRHTETDPDPHPHGRADPDRHPDPTAGRRDDDVTRRDAIRRAESRITDGVMRLAGSSEGASNQPNCPSPPNES